MRHVEVIMRRIEWLILLGAGLLLGLTAGGAPIVPYESDSAAPSTNEIDRLVFERLKELKIERAPLCSDAVFLRRIFLDVTGTLPTALDVQRFVWDRNPNKRRILIDRLLDCETFADYWAMKWSDLLRIKAEFPINLWPNAAQAYHHWIRDELRENAPYDRMARELLTSSGSNFELPPVNFYRAMQNRDPQSIAQTVALTFMGVRAEAWPSNSWASMAEFFANLEYKSTMEWKEQIVFFNPASTNAGAVTHPESAKFPDGTPVVLTPEKDPREVFADWLITDRNPWFNRCIANRVWYWLLGRGIINEPDDIRPDNPPVNPKLLAYLEGQFAGSHYDLRGLYRLILNSQTYQLSSIARSTDAQAAANFAFYAPRRLDAEVLIDALNQVTGSNEKYSSAIPEPYTFIPENQRSIALPDGSITSAFLESFGKPPRDTGFAAERNNHITASQELTLLNSSVVQKKIQQSRMIGYQLETGKTPAELVTGLYLQILSRYPTAAELKTAVSHFQSGNKRETAIDIAWALINTAEFMHRH